MARKAGDDNQTEIEGRRRIVAVMHRIEMVKHKKSEGDEEAGHQTRNEQRADRHVGNGTGNHDQDRRRDDGGERGGAERHADGITLWKSVSLHGLDFDCAHRGDIGDRGAGDAGKDDRRNDVDVAKPTGKPADHGLGEIEDALRHTPALHHRTDQNKEWHGDEKERVHRREHSLRQKVHGHGGEEPQRADTGERQSDGERHTQHTETEKGDEKKDRHGSMSC